MKIKSKEKRHVCYHDDLLTVPEKVREMMKEYAENDWPMEKLSAVGFRLMLNDGHVDIMYDAEKREFVEEIVEYEMETGK